MRPALLQAALAKMRDLCERSGEDVEFAGYLDGIRTRYTPAPR